MLPKRTGFIVSVCLVLQCASVGPAPAAEPGYVYLDPGTQSSVPLIDLTSGEIPGVVVGDKLFDYFTYSSTGDMPPAHLVEVSGITDSEGNYGIRFQGLFYDSLDQEQQFPSDASITFEVAVSDEALQRGWRIHDAHLFGAGIGDFELTGPGSFVSVNEDFAGNNPNIEEGMTVFSSNFGAGGQRLEDWIYFENLYTRLKVQKDIAALTADPQLAQLPAQISIIDQTFSQMQIVIPEPLSISLAAICLGVVTTTRCRRWFRKKEP